MAVTVRMLDVGTWRLHILPTIATESKVDPIQRRRICSVHFISVQGGGAIRSNGISTGHHRLYVHLTSSQSVS